MDSSDEEPEHCQFKVILLGDGAVGKTSVCTRFAGDQFSKQYKQTIGVDFFLKRLELPGDVHVALQIWDIGGQTIGSKMIGNYIYGAHAVLLCYDITNYHSFQDLEDWLRLVRRTFSGREGSEMPYLALIGNKTDMGHLRTVKLDKHNQFADENDMFPFLVSAKTGDQVNAAFHRIAADLSGVVLTRPEIEVATKVVKAKIINHQRNDPAVKEPSREKKGGCSIM
eukprot:TRINITY_DN3246_c0_g1_i1.p1 TRINITY_DN3246_c0_g1~~TRINITY_DN3246_c0_g1_i1.p1  ORF type:complete len:248 (-),score=64.15 TRINITY_DN3246_c0_g1_i1:270-944(-)